MSELGQDGQTKFFHIPGREEKDFLYNLKNSFAQITNRLKAVGRSETAEEMEEFDWETETDNAIILLKACLLSVRTF